ncbi:MAG: hypothetical protein AAFQ81_09290 [Pseudomonadota bacterium]
MSKGLAVHTSAFKVERDGQDLGVVTVSRVDGGLEVISLQPLHEGDAITISVPCADGRIWRASYAVVRSWPHLAEADSIVRMGAHLVRCEDLTEDQIRRWNFVGDPWTKFARAEHEGKGEP